jgi:hypothetical protein
MSMQVVDADKDRLLEMARKELAIAKSDPAHSPVEDALIDAVEAVINAAWLDNAVELVPGKHYLISVPHDMDKAEMTEMAQRLNAANITCTIIRR